MTAGSSHSGYERLDTQDNNYSSPSSSTVLPIHPPDYNDLDLNNNNNNNYHNTDGNDDGDLAHLPTPSIDQFEIEDPIYEEQSSGLLNRAQKFASNFNTRIIRPVTRIIDPIYEGYKYFQMQYERSILKLGNPLVVKRLLYVTFVMALIFAISKYSDNDTISGGSVGTFTRGHFYDIDKLSESIPHFIDEKEMKEHLEYFSSMPHITGTKGDLTLAKYIQKFMKSNGLHHVEFNELQSFTNYPDKKDTYLKLKDNSFEAKLFEQHSEGMEFLAFNPNALNTVEPIEGNYVFVNYGEIDDYKRLANNGIDLTDKIILVKYGGKIPEANKVYIAQEHKVKALVFITPKFHISGQDVDDVIQNQNVGLTRMSPGDILTPGWSSENAYVTRLSWDNSETTPKIPTIPISWRDGEVLLKKLSGGIEFDGFKSGDGESPGLELKITNTNRPKHQIWDVVGSVEGREQSEKGIIIGAARDATCYGTISSNTGTVALLEMIKIFTTLQRKYQWSPSRSIYFVSFDATEYNLAGAAEWIENRKELLRKEGYMYVDLSDLVAGDELSINASPFLNEIITNAMHKVKTGDGKDDDLYHLMLKQNNDHIVMKNQFVEMKNYIPFINLVNIPSMEIKFKGYKYPKNSCFDNFDNFENNQIDPKMAKHAQLVELLSRIVLNAAESGLIPFNFHDFSRRLEDYERDLERYAQSQIDKLDQPNKPSLNFDGLKRAINSLKLASDKYQEWARDWKQFISDSGGIEPTIYTMFRWKWNDNMIEFNGQFLTREIQHKRSGYKNTLFGVPFIAPEKVDEFDWNSFPFIRNHISQNDFSLAQDEIDQLARTLESASISYTDLN